MTTFETLQENLNKTLRGNVRPDNQDADDVFTGDGAAFMFLNGDAFQFLDGQDFEFL